MKAETYTLTCEACGNAYYSKEAFPKQQYCKTCMIAVKAGIKEVVEWIKLNYIEGAFTDRELEDWQSKLKEWGIE